MILHWFVVWHLLTRWAQFVTLVTFKCRVPADSFAIAFRVRSVDVRGDNVWQFSAHLSEF